METHSKSKEPYPLTATLLVVEDDVAAGRSLSKALEQSGYRVVRAASGTAAGTRIRSATPDLVIVSLNVPDADALELAASLERVNGSRTIVCSARHTRLDRQLARRVDAAAWLARPFDMDDVESHIEARLRQAAVA
jgi:DNA-binding response OmpR family regulator